MPAKKAKGPVAKKMSMQAMLSWLEDELVETTFDKLVVLPEGEFARQTLTSPPTRWLFTKSRKSKSSSST